MVTAVPKYLLAILILALPACAKDEPKAKDTAAEKTVELPTISVDELATLIADGKGAAVDANNEATRERQGVIPGAVLLSDSDTFTPSELPADKSRPLVFYCANEKCGASHTAAEKALASGHKDVKVLSAGIAGWTEAGKPVEPGA